jgi:hypothetical protein
MVTALVHVIVANTLWVPAEEHIIPKQFSLCPDANIQYAQAEYIPAIAVNVMHVMAALVM